MSGHVQAELEELIGGFRPVSLEELDARAALLRRVDHKYVLDEDAFAAFAERLQADHEVLEIEGRRSFAYESVYFDTPALRCFHDHVEERAPRFKVRTRYYRDSGRCNFEVKLKTVDGETDKRQIDHPPDDRHRITPDARRFLEEALRDADLQVGEALGPSLRTSFQRMTLAAREGPERLTCDLGVRLASPGGGERRLRGGLLVLESKSDAGHSPADRTLADMGIEAVSLSKYKLGIGMLSEAGAAELDDPNERFFS
jgi:hypothetical protein